MLARTVTDLTTCNVDHFANNEGGSVYKCKDGMLREQWGKGKLGTITEDYRPTRLL